MSFLRILVVEDELIIAAHIAAMLEDLGHHVVAMVATGAEAVSRMSSDNPDLVLMDVALRGKMNGIEAAKQIRRSHRVPIAFMTAYSAEELARQYEEPESLHCISKPVTEDKLQAIIRRAGSEGR